MLLQLGTQMLRVRVVRAPVACIRVVQLICGIRVVQPVTAPKIFAGINLRESISSSKLQIPGSKLQEPNARYYS